MVRKRSRKYDSDENDSDSDSDTDLDFDVEPRSRPAPKKYSLRERKRAPLFTAEEYYCGLDEDEGGRKMSSDDDFEVKTDVNGAGSYFEPDPDAEPENTDGLIDFEDIIRADIVVNRNKIDYDNLIQKTEIKLTQPKKRGRKPKNRIEESPAQEVAEPGIVCEPQLDSFEGLDDIKGEDDVKKEETDEKGGEKNEESKDAGVLPSVDTLENDKESVDINYSTKTEPLEPLPKQEKNEEDDDDVIVLETKQEVIVLDD